MKKLHITLLAAIMLLSAVLLPTRQNTLPLSLSGSDTHTAAAYDFIWPAPNSRHITSGFGNRKITLYGYERLHAGVDINTAVGDPVLAIADGTVIVSVYDGGWGEYIMVNHGDNLISLYAHLNSRSVKRGDIVTAGQEIGTSGNSGLSSGPHLHFELRLHGKSINPFRYTYQ